MNQLAVIDNHANVEAYRASTNAAEICREIVVATATTIQGKSYVTVEGWQAIAVAHGCSAASRDVERVDGGVRAIGEVRRMSDGVVIATAEGFVGEDEPVWYGGEVTDKWGKTKVHQKRADYAIRAMAQTRAISRACRSAFAHVVVMMKAGLATTPAEEVPFEGFDNATGEVIEPKPAPKPKDDPFPPGPAKNKTELKQKASEFWREVEGCGDPDELEALLKAKENVQLVTQLVKALPKWWEGTTRGDEQHEGLEAVISRKHSELAVAAMNAG